MGKTLAAGGILGAEHVRIFRRVFLFKMVWGEYPKEFNPKVHGPYDPSRYYGPKDLKISEVKLGDFMSWLGRRKKTPNAAISAMSRALHRWRHYYVLTRAPLTITPYMQLVIPMAAFAYYINYEKIVAHGHTQKYHW